MLGGHVTDTLLRARSARAPRVRRWTRMRPRHCRTHMSHGARSHWEWSNNPSTPVRDRGPATVVTKDSGARRRRPPLPDDSGLVGWAGGCDKNMHKEGGARPTPRPEPGVHTPSQTGPPGTLLAPAKMAYVMRCDAALCVSARHALKHALGSRQRHGVHCLTCMFPTGEDFTQAEL